MISLLLNIFSSDYIKVKSRFVNLDNKTYILSRPLYPGKYILTGVKKSFNKINYFYLLDYKNSPLNWIRNKIRDRIFLNTVHFRDETRSVILTLILGEKLNKNLSYIYKLGLGHYLAFSGLHVNIIFLTLTFFYNSLWIRIAVFIFIGIYSVVIMSPSVFRALLFMFFKILSDLLNEERSIFKEFIVTLFLALMIFGNNSIALHLSFASSFILMFFNGSKWITPFLIHIVTSVQCLYFFGCFNILSVIPNFVLSFLFFILILLSFLNLILPIGLIVEIFIVLLLKIVELFNQYFMYEIKYQLSIILLYTFYLITLLLFCIIKIRNKKR